jgi:hypothetical protein
LGWQKRRRTAGSQQPERYTKFEPEIDVKMISSFKDEETQKVWNRHNWNLPH